MDKENVAPNGRTDGRYVVAIGASAGGLEPLRELLAELPANLNAPVVIAVHSEPKSKLVDVLKINKSLNIKTPENEEILEAGTIYVVPGATHALFHDGRLRLSDIVEDSGFRPSIDALFMTLAAEYRHEAIAVVLSGMLKDGMRGAQVVYDMKGRTIVQDPDDANCDSMPKSVIRNDHPRVIRTAPELGAWLKWFIGTSE